MDDAEIIREQIDYYRQRAPEYDATAEQADEQLRRDAAAIDAALETFRPAGDVLEIACGTGLGTRRLLKHADTVTALDSSPEAIELAKSKVGHDPRVRFVVADVFSWEPHLAYDVVYFRFWLTHVPPDLFNDFWDRVRRALKPSGRVFFEDDMEGAFHEERVDDTHLVRRPLSSGEEFRVVKVFYDPKDLETRVRRLGWNITVRTSGRLMWGQGGVAHPP